MSQSRKATALTIVVLVAAFAVAVGKKRFSASGEPSSAAPQDAVYATLDASRKGDVRSYLANYGGQMRASLEQSIRETGEERFSKYLKESNSSIKGIAVAEPQAVSDRETALRVEYIYQDRNEVQTMYLERDGANWRIVRVDSSDRIKTLIPYGTPVQ